MPRQLAPPPRRAVTPDAAAAPRDFYSLDYAGQHAAARIRRALRRECTAANWKDMICAVSQARANL